MVALRLPARRSADSGTGRRPRLQARRNPPRRAPSPVSIKLRTEPHQSVPRPGHEGIRWRRTSCANSAARSAWGPDSSSSPSRPGGWISRWKRTSWKRSRGFTATTRSRRAIPSIRLTTVPDDRLWSFERRLSAILAGLGLSEACCTSFLSVKQAHPFTPPLGEKPDSQTRPGGQPAFPGAGGLADQPSARPSAERAPQFPPAERGRTALRDRADFLPGPGRAA